MEYNVKDKIEWTVIFLTEFGRRHGLTLRQAFNYLLRYKGIGFVEQHYDYLRIRSRSRRLWTISHSIAINWEEE